MKGLKSDNYSVYIHTCPNGKVYVGITSLDVNYRWRCDGSGYKNQMFYRAIEKYGWNNITHDVIYCGLCKEDAEKAEIDLISKYKSNNPSFGYNIEGGGNANGKTGKSTREKLRIANIGKKKSQKEKELMRLRMTGSNNFNYGKPMSDATKQKLRNANTGRKFSLSNDAKRKIRNSRIEKYSTPVVQMTAEGVVVNVFSCIKDAEVQTGIFNVGSCCKGKYISAGGYIWRYKGDEHVKTRKHKKKTPVTQYHADGEYVNFFESVADASRMTGISASSIFQVLRGGSRLAGGYKWSRL